MSSSSSSDETYTDKTHINDSQDGKNKKQIGATTMAQLTKAHNPGRKFLIAFHVFYRVVDGELFALFKSYVAFLECKKSLY